jgi:hypothetical protein
MKIYNLKQICCSENSGFDLYSCTEITSFKALIIRTYALRSPNPLKKGALEIPPFLRGIKVSGFSA